MLREPEGVEEPVLLRVAVSHGIPEGLPFSEILPEVIAALYSSNRSLQSGQRVILGSSVWAIS